MRVCVIVALLISIGAVNVPVAAASQADGRARVFATLPNWTGMWVADDNIYNTLGVAVSGYPPGGPNEAEEKEVTIRLDSRNEPLNAKAKASMAALLKSVNKFQQSGTGAPPVPRICMAYFPAVMEGTVIEFLITPEQTLMVGEQREIRHIYTNGRSHPPAEDLWLTPWGDSVGHWEGDTLVVDTVAVKPWLIPFLSERAHFTERLRMIDADHLQDQMTINDPANLTGPWTVTIRYQRAEGLGLGRMVHGDCLENDRNPVVDGKLTIAPAK